MGSCKHKTFRVMGKAVIDVSVSYEAGTYVSAIAKAVRDTSVEKTGSHQLQKHIVAALGLPEGTEARLNSVHWLYATEAENFPAFEEVIFRVHHFEVDISDDLVKVTYPSTLGKQEIERRFSQTIEETRDVYEDSGCRLTWLDAVIGKINGMDGCSCMLLHQETEEIEIELK